MSYEESVEASSITISSKSPTVCPRMLPMLSPTNRSAL